MISHDVLRAARKEEEHQHVWSSFNSGCLHCGITIKEFREEEQHKMLVEALNRLSAVLQKLEAKL